MKNHIVFLKFSHFALLNSFKLSFKKFEEAD